MSFTIPENTASLLFFTLIVAYIGFIFFALFKLAKSSNSLAVKLLYLLLIVVVPIIGSIIYLWSEAETKRQNFRRI